MKPGLSLKGKGVQLLAQREHSRTELRRKLLAYARRVRAAFAADGSGSVGAAPALATDRVQVDASLSPPRESPENGDAFALGFGRNSAEAEAEASLCTSADEEVEAVLDWLQAHRYLCEERFLESRVHTRLPRFGNLRIRQELAQHGLALSPENAEALKASEFGRARNVWARKFGEKLPVDVAERGKQARFLAGRGFSREVIRRLLLGNDLD